MDKGGGSSQPVKSNREPEGSSSGIMSTGSPPKRPRDDPGGESAAVVTAEPPRPKPTPMNIATISSGFEKGDFLVREEKGMRVYFDFFEEAFNYISNRGYIRMGKDDEEDWIQLMNHIHTSVKGGMRYNTGKLLMVLYRPIEDKDQPNGVGRGDNSGGSTEGPK